MARFVVERMFPGGLGMPVSDAGVAEVLAVVDRNAEVGVTWIHSFVSSDRTKTFCIYDGPDEECVRRAAERNRLPVDTVTRVTVLDPYAYR
jgi:Protein of unknown function (DUF4242)